MSSDSGVVEPVVAAAQGQPPETSDEVNEPIASSITTKPVLSLLGKPVTDGEPLDSTGTTAEPMVEPEVAKAPVEPEVVKPLVTEDQPSTEQGQLPPKAKPEMVLEQPAPEAISSPGSAASAVPAKNQPNPEQEAIALREAASAAFNHVPGSSIAAAYKRDKPEVAISSNQPSASSNIAPAVTTGSYGAPQGVTVYRDPSPETVVGKVLKLKHSSEQVYFLKVAKDLPTKIRLLPDPKGKPISFLSNDQDWVVKQFNQGVVIVERKPNASSSSVADLLIQYGDRFYSFTLALTRNTADRDNMIIFEK
ncbi:hypothetical protein D3C84_672530 [compost metagenome]